MCAQADIMRHFTLSCQLRILQVDLHDALQSYSASPSVGKVGVFVTSNHMQRKYYKSFAMHKIRVHDRLTSLCTACSGPERRGDGLLSTSDHGLPKASVRHLPDLMEPGSSPALMIKSSALPGSHRRPGEAREDMTSTRPPAYHQCTPQRGWGSMGSSSELVRPCGSQALP